MDLQALKIFYSVANSGSISQAARELNYAQSNITTRIQQLETDLQTILFYRHNRGTTLTDKGELLLDYTVKIFQLLEETRAVMSDNETPKGPLIIGSMETTAAVRLPALLLKYHHEFPEVDLTVKTGPTELNVQRVLQYKIDGAFVAGPIEHEELMYKTVFEEELVLVSASMHPPITTMKDIHNRTLLVFRKGCTYRAKLEEWLHQEGLISQKIMEFGTLEGIIGCVSAGLGISLLPRSVIEKYAKEGVVRQHSMPNVNGKNNTIFIYRQDGYKSSSFMKFLDMLSSEMDN